ncbi:MAG: hypothetical protein C0467_23080 [Planctomycetaceae bacterium]|nr:hypothetical protein [Planctomycetaceae bacterium]
MHPRILTTAKNLAVALGCTAVATFGLGVVAFAQNPKTPPEFNKKDPPQGKEVGLEWIVRNGTLAGPIVKTQAEIKKTFSLPAGEYEPLHFQDAMVPVVITKQSSWVRLALPDLSEKEHKASIRDGFTHSWTHLTKLQKRLETAEGKELKAFREDLMPALESAIAADRKHAEEKGRVINSVVPAGLWFVPWQLVETVTITYDWDKKDAYAVVLSMPKGSTSEATRTAVKPHLSRLKVSWPKEVYVIAIRDQVDTFQEKLPAPKK